MLERSRVRRSACHLYVDNLLARALNALTHFQAPGFRRNSRRASPVNMSYVHVQLTREADLSHDSKLIAIGDVD